MSREISVDCHGDKPDRKARVAEVEAALATAYARWEELEAIQSASG